MLSKRQLRVTCKSRLWTADGTLLLHTCQYHCASRHYSHMTQSVTLLTAHCCSVTHRRSIQPAEYSLLTASPQATQPSSERGLIGQLGDNFVELPSGTCTARVTGLMLGRLRQYSQLQHGLRCYTAFEQQQHQQQPDRSLLSPSLQSQWQLCSLTNLVDNIVEPGSGRMVWTCSQCSENYLEWKVRVHQRGTPLVVSQVHDQHLQAEPSDSQQKPSAR